MGAFKMRCLLKLLASILAFAACSAALAQTPTYKNVGRTPTQDEIKAWDIAVGPTGRELPPGSGTSKEGATIFAQKCARCHGETGEGSTLGRALVGGQGTLTSLHPVRTVGSYWPFATTLWDYINRAMPPLQGGSLAPNEVYSLTAFVLYRNGIVKEEDDVLDAKTLPKVQMPNRNGFVPPRLEDIYEYNKRACHTGTCP